jgi:hypothetical protein
VNEVFIDQLKAKVHRGQTDWIRIAKAGQLGLG